MSSHFVPRNVWDNILGFVQNRISMEAGSNANGLDEQHKYQIVQGAIEDVVPRMPVDQKRRLIQEVYDEMFLLGPLEPLLASPKVTEIMVNGPDQVFVEIGGKISRTKQQFTDDANIRKFIDRIVSADNRRCDESSPLCDCVLRRPGEPCDGSRVNTVIPPICCDHPIIDIRKFRNDVTAPDQLMKFGTFDERMREFMECLVKGRMNIVVIGGTGSGKTTLLNALATYIPNNERIITIEDTAELSIKKPQVVRLEKRDANAEGTGEISIQRLVVNALRMRPDRIVIGECRGGEALDMFQAMSTGHDGSLTTAHANSPTKSIERMTTMVQMSGYDIPVNTIKQIISDAVDFIINVQRFRDGSRRIVEITEVQGFSGDTVTMEPIWKFIREGEDENGKTIGHFEPTGMLPSNAVMDRMAGNGVRINRNLFNN